VGIAGIYHHLVSKIPDMLDVVTHPGVIFDVGVKNFLENSHSRISLERGKSETLVIGR